MLGNIAILLIFSAACNYCIFTSTGERRDSAVLERRHGARGHEGCIHNFIYAVLLIVANIFYTCTVLQWTLRCGKCGRPRATARRLPARKRGEVSSTICMHLVTYECFSCVYCAVQAWW